MVQSLVKQEFRWKMRKSGKRLLNVCTVFSVYSALALGVMAVPAMANPQGGAVVDGAASIGTVGSELQIHQTSQKTIIEWSSFDIDAGETTRFYQPSSSALALNRVVNSNQISKINGNLVANGRVILVNPNGVLIGATGNIDANGFIATTADIDNAAFMNNTVLNFNRAGKLDGVVQNEGQITIADEGLGALVAPVVRNDGIIQGNMIKVQLAAADTFAVDFFGDGLLSLAVDPDPQTRALLSENSGSIITDGGKVLMSAADASNVVSSAINMSGTIAANSLVVKNGEIILTAGGADVSVSGKLDVSGIEPAAGGGTIKIGGDVKGSGTLPIADTVTIDPTAVLKADGGASADGGEITLWSDTSTELHGTFSARGGDTSGNGGFIETSSAGTFGSTGTRVDTQAPNGTIGTWMIDPTNITVYETGSPGINGIDGIDVADINGSATNYSLIADDTVSFQADINITTFGAGLIAIGGDQTGSDIADPYSGDSVAAGIGGISLANNFIRTNGGDVSFLTGGAISVNNATFFLQGGDLTLTAGSISINNNAAIATAGGDVTLTAIAAGTGSNKTSGNISTNSVNIETTDLTAMVIGGISVTDEDGVQDYENDYGNPQNEFYDNSPGGAIIINADGTAGGNSVCFAAGSAGNCVVVDPLPPTMITITADDLIKIYGDSDPLLTYSFTGTLAGGDSFSGSLVRNSGENVGDYTILQGTLDIIGGNAVYDITYVAGTFTINPAELTIAADHKTKVYGEVDPALTFMASGFKFMDDESLLTGALDRNAGEDVAFYDINQNTLDAGANYTITYIGHDLEITPAMLTITANDDSKVYDSLAYSGGNGVMYSGFVLGDDSGDLGGALAFGGTSQGAIDVGTYVIEASGLTSGNYAISYVDGALDVTAAALTVTANDQSKTYGDTFTFTGTEFMTSGLLGMDSVDSATLASTGAVNTANVGDYDIDVSAASGSGLGNYNITYVDGTLSVDPAALTITANDDSKVYDAVAYSGGNGVVYSGFVNGEDDSALTGSIVFGGTSQGAVNVGNYVIEASGQTSGNYTISYVDGTLDITAADLLIVTPDDQSKTYGDTFSFTGTEFMTSGLLGMDSVDSVTLASTGAVNTANVGDYSITSSDAMGSGLGNYTITYGTGTLSVDPATLNVVADPQMKIYGDSDPMLTFMASGFKNMEDESILTGALDRDAGENVGTYAINQNTLDAGSNYTISYTGDDLDITPATLSVIADHKVKEYGDADPTLTFAASGFKFTDDESILSGVLDRDAGENVGLYDINQNTLDAGSNYTISYTGHDLDITPATLTITADPKSKLLGGVDPELTYVASGFKFTDDESILIGALDRDPGEDVGAYEINQGTLDLASLQGQGQEQEREQSPNYVIDYFSDFLTIFALPAEPVVVAPLLEIDPLGRPIISVANQSIIFDSSFEEIETLEVNTNVSIAYGAAPASTQVLAGLQPASGGQASQVSDLANFEPASGGQASDLADFEPAAGSAAAAGPAAGGDEIDAIACANAFLDNNPCDVDIAP